MKAFIIVQKPERIIFPDRDSIALTPEEYASLYGRVPCREGEMFCVSVDYKGPSNTQICVLDLVEAGKMQMVDLAKLTVAQVTNLLKL